MLDTAQRAEAVDILYRHGYRGINKNDVGDYTVPVGDLGEVAITPEGYVKFTDLAKVLDTYLCTGAVNQLVASYFKRDKSEERNK